MNYVCFTALAAALLSIPVPSMAEPLDCGRFENRTERVFELYDEAADANRKLALLRDGYACLSEPAFESANAPSRAPAFSSGRGEKSRPPQRQPPLTEFIERAGEQFDHKLRAAGTSRTALWTMQEDLLAYETLTANPARTLGAAGTVPVGLDKLPQDVQQRVDAYRNSALKSFWDHFNAALTLNVGRRRTIEDANLATVTDELGQATQVVQIESADSYKSRMGLEAHLYVWGTTFGNQSGSFSVGLNAGPYINLALGSTELVDAVGAGLLIGLLGNGNVDPASGKYYMNFGLGWFVDPNCLDVEKGFRNGEPLPDGETAVRLRRVTDHGPQLLLSFGLRFAQSP